MSPPIRDGSGSGIGSIRLGDGSEISEVRTGAGDVLFSATTIPNSGDHQWHMDEGSGNTLADSVGTVSATINGATWESESGTVGGQYLDLNGTSDFIETDSDISVAAPDLTVFGWVRPQDYTAFGNIFAASGNDPGGGSGWYVGTEGTDGELLTVVNGGSRIRGHPFVSSGNWGFFAFIMTSSQHRVITFSNSQELADSVFSGIDNDGSGVLQIGRNPAGGQNLDGGVDFYGAAQTTALSKSTLTELWKSTQR